MVLRPRFSERLGGMLKVFRNDVVNQAGLVDLLALSVLTSVSSLVGIDPSDGHLSMTADLSLAEPVTSGSVGRCGIGDISYILRRGLI